MGKIKNISTIIIIGVLRRVSQIIFSVLYTPIQKTHLGITTGPWTNSITMTGFETQQIMNFIESKPLPITTGILERFNKNCQYGIGFCKGFRGQDSIAALTRLNTIQYIGKEIDLTQPSDITNHFYTLHSLDPHREYPHLFAQYIGPSTKKNDSDQELARLSRTNTILIGEEGIRYSCDMNKINKISELNYQEFLEAINTHNPTYWYPCTSDDLAHALAFNYYHYFDDTKKASLYYMVASFHDKTPKITLSMPAIIQGRDGNNKISAFLWYDRLQNHYTEIQKKDIPDDKYEQLKNNITTATQKMVSEFALHIITQGTKEALEKKEPKDCAYSLNCLENKGYIKQVIEQIKSNCKADAISCEIIMIGIKSKRINDSKIISYPADPGMTYEWQTDKQLWRIKLKDT